MEKYHLLIDETFRYNFEMTKRPLLFLTVSLILFLLASCAPKTVTPDTNFLINQAVAATLAAIPTIAPAIPPTPYPTPTAVSLAGLYCEYLFCIGHPASMAFYDHLATLNLGEPSTYNKGFLYSYQIPNMIISLIWLQAPGTSDPKFLLDTILDDQADTQTGNLDVKLIRNMNVIYIRKRGRMDLWRPRLRLESLHLASRDRHSTI
jgi:hypothetical protein